MSLTAQVVAFAYVAGVVYGFAVVLYLVLDLWREHRVARGVRVACRRLRVVEDRLEGLGPTPGASRALGELVAERRRLERGEGDGDG